MLRYRSSIFISLESEFWHLLLAFNSYSQNVSLISRRKVFGDSRRFMVTNMFTSSNYNTLLVLLFCHSMSRMLFHRTVRKIVSRFSIFSFNYFWLLSFVHFLFSFSWYWIQCLVSDGCLTTTFPPKDDSRIFHRCVETEKERKRWTYVNNIYTLCRNTCRFYSHQSTGCVQYWRRIWQTHSIDESVLAIQYGVLIYFMHYHTTEYGSLTVSTRFFYSVRKHGDEFHETFLRLIWSEVPGSQCELIGVWDVWSGIHSLGVIF